MGIRTPRLSQDLTLKEEQKAKLRELVIKYAKPVSIRTPDGKRIQKLRVDAIFDSFFEAYPAMKEKICYNPKESKGNRRKRFVYILNKRINKTDTIQYGSIAAE